MAKIILGERPKNFLHTVHFKMLDGSPGQIDVTYTYRTRTEFGRFADDIRDQATAGDAAMVEKIKTLAKDGKSLPQADILAQENATNVAYVMGCIEGWNLDVDFSKSAVEQLADELPAAISAIIGTYRDAIIEGRLGN
jgi:hypothetical protein